MTSSDQPQFSQPFSTSPKTGNSSSTPGSDRQRSIDLLLEIMDLQAAANPELAAKQRRLLDALSKRLRNAPPDGSTK